MRALLTYIAAGLLYAVALFTCATATAAPASDASIEKLLGLNRTQGFLESIYGSVDQSVKRGLNEATKDSTLTPAQQAVVNALPGRVEVLLRDAMSWDKLRPEFITLYRQTFDQEEVDGLIEFFGSKTGRAFVHKMPVLQQSALVISQKYLQNILPQVQALVQQALNDAKIVRPGVQAPPAATTAQPPGV